MVSLKGVIDNFSDRQFLGELRKCGIERIVVEPYPEVVDGYLRPQRAAEYSISEGTLKNMDLRLKREVYKALHFSDALVEIVYQCGETLYLRGVRDNG